MMFEFPGLQSHQKLLVLIQSMQQLQIDMKTWNDLKQQYRAPPTRQFWAQCIMVCILCEQKIKSEWKKFAESVTNKNMALKKLYIVEFEFNRITAYLYLAAFVNRKRSYVSSVLQCF